MHIARRLEQRLRRQSIRARTRPQTSVLSRLNVDRRISDDHGLLRRNAMLPQEIVHAQRIRLLGLKAVAAVNALEISVQPQRIHDLARPFFEKAGLLPSNLDARIENWFNSVVDLLVPYVDQLDQLPERANLVFHYHAASARSAQDNAEVFASDKTRPVIQAFANRAGNESPVTAERFKTIMDEVKAETGAKGKDLFHPVRVVLIGSHSGPAFDKLIPLLEEGSTLELPVHVKNVRERIAEFITVLDQR